METDLKSLIETHIKANRLAKEIKKTRGNIIQAFKNKDSSDLYIEKLNYTGFAAALAKETAIFDQLLKKLEGGNYFINNCDINSEIAENFHSDSSSTISEKSSLENNYNDNKEHKIETETETEKEIYLNELSNDPIPVTDEICITIPQQDDKEETVNVLPIENKTQKRKQCKKMNKKAVVDYPLLGTNKRVLNNKKITNIKKGSKISSISSGLYKYSGKGFEIFTNYKNKCKPMYSSIILYCTETCNENETELINYLIEFGKFNSSMIENIEFKTRGYYDRYTLIKVRGEVKYIKKKIKTLNKRKGCEIISLKKRTKIISAKDMSNKLYVNNFDILRKNTHKRFTKLFLKYGELVRDIKMGKDKYGDIYAIVYFRDINDAKECCESELQFDGKVLNIKFSKF